MGGDVRTLKLVPVIRKEVNRFIIAEHRHHRPTIGYRFAIGAQEGDKLVGIVVVGRPVARNIDWRKVAEVTRLATDGTNNACSFLYSAAARAAKAMGYEKIQTYILAEEPGTSLRAAGWVLDGATRGSSWAHMENRQMLLTGGTRANDHPLGNKQRWVKELL